MSNSGIQPVGGRLERTTRVALRLPSSLVAKLDEHAERMRRAQPGVEVSRTDVVRFLLTCAIAQLEPPRSRSRARPAKSRSTRSED